MRIELDALGVADLARRFGDLHDSVLRRLSWELGPAQRIEIAIDALAMDGAWWRLTLAVSGVSELRLAEGVAIWGNATSWDVTTHHPDGTATRETRRRDLGDLHLGGPTNQVIFGAAIHLVPDGIFVDLSPGDLVQPSAVTDPAEWRRSTFYVFGRRGEARVEPLDVAPEDLRSRFLRHGAITKFFRREQLDGAISALTGACYRVHVIDASSCALLREQLTRVLRFQESFGYEPWTGNLDALNDAFREIDYESVAGVVLAFLRFDLLNAEDPRTASGLLDIIELASRDGLLAGVQLIGLVQSDDPTLDLGPAGARAPMWNGGEWLNSSRGL